MPVKEIKDLMPAVDRLLGAVIRTIMRKERMAGAVIAVELIVLAQPLQFGLGPVDLVGCGVRIFVAEQASRIVGIAICSERYFPGWVGPTVALLDLCVEARHRGRGIGTALLSRTAEFAKARDSVMLELTMRAGNRAATLYERVGFAEVTEIRNYVIAGDALDRLATSAPAPARMAG